jgi:hypothetical protein
MCKSSSSALGRPFGATGGRWTGFGFTVAFGFGVACTVGRAGCAGVAGVVAAGVVAAGVVAAGVVVPGVVDAGVVEGPAGEAGVVAAGVEVAGGVGVVDTGVVGWTTGVTGSAVAPESPPFISVIAPMPRARTSAASANTLTGVEICVLTVFLSAVRAYALKE